MEEKKLTDEEIVKALEWIAGQYISYIDNDNDKCKLLLVDDILDLIHRLQSENEKLKDEKEEIKLFNLSIQNGEVDMRIESEMAKSFYNSIVQIFEQNGAKNFFTVTVDIEGKKGRYAFTIEKVGGQTVAEKLAEQKAEIERLTKRLELADKDNDNLAKTIFEYEKQVDELKEKNGHLHKLIVEEMVSVKAVRAAKNYPSAMKMLVESIGCVQKDTAKKIITEIDSELYNISRMYLECVAKERKEEILINNYGVMQIAHDVVMKVAVKHGVEVE